MFRLKSVGFAGAPVNPAAGLRPAGWTCHGVETTDAARPPPGMGGGRFPTVAVGGYSLDDCRCVTGIFVAAAVEAMEGMVTVRTPSTYSAVTSLAVVPGGSETIRSKLP